MVEMPAVRLSSRLTFLYKFIFPTVWILGFAGGTLAMLRSGEPMAAGFAVATLAGTLFLSATCFPLKSVIAVHDGIVVSNFVRQIKVPYDEIVSVNENKWLNTHDITISLRSHSAFGQKIRFQPYSEFTLRFWRDHASVVLLRERAGIALPTI